MQDKFVGDFGDYPKFGLLRALAGMPDGESTLTLGVVWYVPDQRTIDKTPDSHGQDLDYLSYARGYRECDPDLFDRLREVVDTNRCLAALEQSSILGERTRFWSEQMRPATRQRWLQQALERTVESDIVFLDPDVGLATAAMEKKAHSPKHVHRHELRAFLRWSRRQTVVVYQHHPQNFNDRPSQLKAWDAALGARLSAAPPQAITYRNRDLVVLPDDRHAGLLDARIGAFLSGPWGRHVQHSTLRAT